MKTLIFCIDSVLICYLPCLTLYSKKEKKEKPTYDTITVSFINRYITSVKFLFNMVTNMQYTYLPIY